MRENIQANVFNFYTSRLIPDVHIFIIRKEWNLFLIRLNTGKCFKYITSIVMQAQIECVADYRLWRIRSSLSLFWLMTVISYNVGHYWA